MLTTFGVYFKKSVRKVGVEPTSLAAQASETCAYANSATSANFLIIYRFLIGT